MDVRGGKIMSLSFYVKKLLRAIRMVRARRVKGLEVEAILCGSFSGVCKIADY